MDESRTILVVTGLQREAKVIARPGFRIVVSGGSRAALESRLAQIDRRGLSAVVSLGLAGALDPALRPGDVVLGSEIIAGDRHFATGPQMVGACQNSLRKAGIPFKTAPIAGVDGPVMTAAAKSALHKSTGAAVVDMESHVAAGFAADCGLEMVGLRVVSDGANRTLPPIISRTMRPDGGIDLPALILGLARRPSQIPALIRTGQEAAIAFRRLGEIASALSL